MRTNMSTTNVQVLGFKKDKGIWYADLPEFLEEGLGTTADLMMVDGSDKFLDILSGNQNAVVLKISPKKYKGFQTKMQKIRIGLDQSLLDAVGHAPVDYGAYYKVSELNGKSFDHQLWLCPVTEYVFGSYPDEIFASVVTR